MRIGKRKAVALSGGSLLLVAAVLAAIADNVRVLLLIILFTLMGGLAILAVALINTQRLVDRRLRRIESIVTKTISTSLADPTFIRRLRQAALPQEHVEQFLRTIEAGNVRLETSQQQLARRVDSVLASHTDRTGEGAMPRGEGRDDPGAGATGSSG